MYVLWMGSAIETQRGFRHEMNRHEAPSPNAIRRWVRQWCREGSVACNKPPDRPSSVRIPENTARVFASVGRGPSKHAKSLGMSDRSVRHILHSDLNLHPYKVQSVHSLIDRDKDVRSQLCRHFHGILPENLTLPNNRLMSQEAHFHLHGTVNTQNFRHSSVANPHQLHQLPLYDPKVTVWCAVWSRGVFGPYIFEDENGEALTVISQRNTEMINEFLAPKLPPHHNLWFQQDGATSHTAVISVAALRSLFSQRVAARFGDARPPRSPEITAHDFFSVGLFEK